MSEVFLFLLNRAAAAGWMLLALLLLRPLLKRCPGWARCLLWALAAVRLVLPVQIESVWSLVPSTEILAPEAVRYYAVPRVTSGIGALNRALNERLMEPFFCSAEPVSANPLYIWSWIAGIIWAAGCCGLLGYALVRVWQTKRRLREAVPLGDGVLLCDAVPSPFILGVLRPQICLPSGMPEGARQYVLVHERAHLARRDHWWKPLGYLLLCVYWFQPLCWLAYRCFCRDLELACDERAIQTMDLDGRRAYSSALVDCSVQGRAVLACPLAFGEIAVKERVKRVLQYKKPTFWISMAAILLCAVLTVCFLTNRKTTEPAARPAADSSGSNLTLEDVQRLAEQGTALCWADFDAFSYQDRSSGSLEIRIYPIDAHLSLRIAGSYPEANYFWLQANDGTDELVDLRENAEMVPQFIETHEQNAALDAYDMSDLSKGSIQLTVQAGEDALSLTQTMLWTNSMRIRVGASALEKGAQVYLYLYSAENTDDAIGYAVLTAEEPAAVFDHLTAAAVYRIGAAVKESSQAVTLTISDDTENASSYGLHPAG